MKTVYAMTLVAAALGAGPLWAAQDGSVGRDENKPMAEKSLGEGQQRLRAGSSGTGTKLTPAQLHTIAAMFRAEVGKCWQIPLSVQAQVNKPVVVIRVMLDEEGGVSGEPQVVSAEGPEEFRQAYAESAIRALRMCQPYSIAKKFPQFYDTWKEISMRFDPGEL